MLYKRISFRIDNDRYELLKRVAIDKGFGVSSIVRSLIYSFLKGYEVLDYKNIKPGRKK